MNELHSFASLEAASLYDEVRGAESADALDCAVRHLYRCYCDGSIGDADATALQSFIDARRPLARARLPVFARPVNSGSARMIGRFKPRQHPRSPDRKASRDRRRVLGGSAILPPELRSCYTEGQRAVLTIIGGEIKHHGVCDLPIDKIAALAGVCRTTVQTTLHEARRLGHIKITERPVRGRKNLTNVVTIISAAWTGWLKRGPTAHRPIGSNSVKKVSPTKNTDLNTKRESENREVERGIRGVPYGTASPNPTTSRAA